MPFLDFGPIDILGVATDFDENGHLCFLAGISGEANLERQEVIRLIAVSYTHLTLPTKRIV